MQWSNAPNGGFSPAGTVTWLPVNDNFARGVNVAEQRQDAGSLLTFYRRLIRLRRDHPALTRGDCQFVDADAPGYLAYRRSAGGESCLVALNMSDHAQSAGLDLPAGVLRMLLTSDVRPPRQDAHDPVQLAAHEVYIAQLE